MFVERLSEVYEIPEALDHDNIQFHHAVKCVMATAIAFFFFPAGVCL